jgi:hypothetical protein
VAVWTDAAGTPVGRPRRPALDAVLAGLGAAAGVALLVGCAWLAVRRLTDRYRLAAWQAAWAVVGPQWRNG